MVMNRGPLLILSKLCRLHLQTVMFLQHMHLSYGIVIQMEKKKRQTRNLQISHAAHMHMALLVQQELLWREAKISLKAPSHVVKVLKASIYLVLVVHMELLVWQHLTWQERKWHT